MTSLGPAPDGDLIEMAAADMAAGIISGDLLVGDFLAADIEFSIGWVLHGSELNPFPISCVLAGWLTRQIAMHVLLPGDVSSHLVLDPT